MRWGLLVLVALGGCRTRLLDDAAAGDGGAPYDAAASCTSRHDRVEVPLTRLEPIDFTPFVGSAVRARVGFPWRPACDVLADVDVLQSARDGADLLIVAHVWRSTDSACTGSVEATAVVVLSDAAAPSAGKFIVAADDAAGGTLSLGFDIGDAAPGSDCSAALLEGRCVRDCQCAAAIPSARCISIKQGAIGPSGVCAVSCGEDAACPDTAPDCSKTLALFSCAPGSGCAGDAECPFGQRCQNIGGSGACRPPSQQPQLPTSCRCSADCGFGAVCALVGEDALGCVAPCAIDADCPGHGACGATCVSGRCTPTPCK